MADAEAPRVQLPSRPPSAVLKAVPEIAPAASVVVRKGLAIERWWTVFGDAALERLMDEALAHNEDLESAVARVREAQAVLQVTRAGQSPTVDAQVKGSRQRQSEVGATPIPPGLNNPTGSLNIGLTAGYEVDLWDKLSSATAAARSQLLATEWAHASVQWGLTARVAEAYFGLAAVDRQIEISESVREGRRATLVARQRELAAGAGSEFDLRRAEAEVSSADATLASLARTRVNLERTLTLLLGRTPEAIAAGTLERRALDERMAPSAVLPEGEVAHLLSRRPDVRQAEAQLAAANFSIEAARAATLPSFRLSGTLGNDVRSIGNLLSPAALVWSLVTSVTQPIVDGGKLKAKVAEEQARAEQAVAGYRKAVGAAVADVREAYASLDLTDQALQAETARAASLAKAREMAALGYDAGALTYLDLLDADRNWHQARLQQVTAHRDRLIGQVAAFKALGGGHAAKNIQGRT